MGNETQDSPVVAITMGDPAGIGPEIVVKALSGGVRSRKFTPLVIGDKATLVRIADQMGERVNFTEWRPGTRPSGSGPFVYDLANAGGDVEPGIESTSSGRASAEYIEASIDLWKKGLIDAVATAPISKNALSLAGYGFPGHTEFFAERTGTSRFAMSFFAGNLRVVLLSTHLSLRNAIELVKKDAITELIRFSDSQLSRLLRRSIKIAVAGLNPHASEGGMFGSEEADEMIPAIEQCRGEGIDVSGPYSPDTIFVRANRGDFDAVIACYHDQATIAVKSLAFGSAVNVTLGLPLIRTSVDHGTAFDIAGEGIADASSMTAAIELAAELAAANG